MYLQKRILRTVGIIFLSLTAVACAKTDTGKNETTMTSQAVEASGAEMPDETSLAGMAASDETSPSSQAAAEETAAKTDEAAQSDSSADPEIIPAPDFTLVDQEGNTHKLSDYKGKTVFLNFWATWCPPCRMEMPDIQKLYEKHGNNSENLIVLGVAGPKMGSEKDIAGITAFLKENNYSFPVVMDETGTVFAEYGISAFPTTFMIDDEGNVHGYVNGALSAEFMDSIVQQTMDKVHY